MAVSHKYWELPNLRIWLAEIDFESGLVFPIQTGNIQQFPDFLESIPGNIGTICLSFRNYRYFRVNGKHPRWLSSKAIKHDGYSPPLFIFCCRGLITWDLNELQEWLTSMSTCLNWKEKNNCREHFAWYIKCSLKPEFLTKYLTISPLQVNISVHRPPPSPTPFSFLWLDENEPCS